MVFGHLISPCFVLCRPAITALPVFQAEDMANDFSFIAYSTASNSQRETDFADIFFFFSKILEQFLMGSASVRYLLMDAVCSQGTVTGESIDLSYLD